MGSAVTFSPALTLVPTRGCFNDCAYCGFRLPPTQADPLADGEAVEAMRARPEAAEILLLSGEVAPGSPQRAAWFARLVRLSRLALMAGRLPHTNAGPLSLAEMAALGRLNPSMGLMLEGLGPAYAALHRRAPSKAESVRIDQIAQAGRLGIPFTTGLLLGVGESAADRERALTLIARLQDRFGHIQEVILQPWRPGDAAAQPLNRRERADVLDAVVMARALLPGSIHLQLPANLWPIDQLPRALEAGIDDLGGIDDRDVINPAYRQPTHDALRRCVAQAGRRLEARLCVHREWQRWLSGPLRHAAEVTEQLLASRHHRF
ncbi:7,8-didemethyl-8-hydroxy-5-deazariboflavin synthase subunit CofG [Synechococcus sp. RSCCF101]|uniref:7,8-didemethyl-8-hydroxy-5-deazariboflavin synthase subunit CofG n=1 Tax=Synechococcus sp. RSCCF101 TaxID=2511069 RepID=UPI001CD94FBE|nr:7,8-didemethyl-8-hydroxy-5-deazariboflavin synthase subunit CofG [Synechococcus sp. RSCCF101]